MEKENNFKDTVNSLFKGMDGFVSAKTVVGDAIHVGDTIILPLVDVSFGVGAGAFEGFLFSAERKICIRASGICRILYNSPEGARDAETRRTIWNYDKNNNARGGSSGCCRIRCRRR